jgi:two-component sensor histidine kinase
MVLGGSLNHILDRTAPLYFKVNAEGEVLYISKLFLKAIGKDFTGQQVEDLFILSKPFAEVISKLHNEKSSLDELVFLNSSDGKQKYKAGIHLVENDFFFTCNPIINSNFLIKDYNLTINDFPIHDTMYEFVFAQSANQAALRDVTNLYEKVAHRKEELINKNKELTFLLGEVHHRVKNNLAFISSLIEIESEHSALTEVKGTLGGIQSRIKSIALIHESMYKSDLYSELSIKTYFSDLINILLEFYNLQGKIELDIQIEDILFKGEKIVPLSMLLHELLTNAIKHTLAQAERPELSISFVKQNSDIIFSLCDHSNRNVEVLPKKGFQLIDIFVSQLKGKKETHLENGFQTVITFPY